MKLSTALTAFLALATVTDGFMMAVSSSSSPKSTFGLKLERPTALNAEVNNEADVDMDAEAHRQVSAADENFKKASEALKALENAAHADNKSKGGGSAGLKDPSTDIKTVAVTADARLTDYTTEENTVVTKSEDELTVTKTAVETATFQEDGTDLDARIESLKKSAEPKLAQSMERQANLVSDAEKAANAAKLAAEKTFGVDRAEDSIKAQEEDLLAAKLKAESAVVQAEEEAAALAAAIEQAKIDAARLAKEEAGAKDVVGDLSEELRRTARLAEVEGKKKTEAEKKAKGQEAVMVKAEAQADEAAKLANAKAEAERIAKQKAADLLAEEEAIQARIAELEKLRLEAENIAAQEAKLKEKAIADADKKQSIALSAKDNVKAAEEEAAAKARIEAQARARVEELAKLEKEMRAQIAEFAAMREKAAKKVAEEAKRLKAAEAKADNKEIELARAAMEIATKEQEFARLEEEKHLLEMKVVEEKAKEAELMAKAKAEQEKRVTLERDVYGAEVKLMKEKAENLNEDTAVVKDLIADEQRRMQEKMAELQAKLGEMESEKSEIMGAIGSESEKQQKMASITERIAAERKRAEEAAATIKSTMGQLSEEEVVAAVPAQTTPTEVDVDVKVVTDVKVDGETVEHTEKQGRLSGLLKRVVGRKD